MSLRVGYVNTQGLNQEKWRKVCSMLDEKFDLLFIGETWFGNGFKHYRCDKRFIAHTVQGSEVRGGACRAIGGVYLLGTTAVRGRGLTFVTTEHSITVRVGKDYVTGVYYPPSLPVEALVADLATLQHNTTVLMGDVNTRFPGCTR